MSVAPMLPPSHEWTPEEYDALPADGVRRELVEGVLHVSPSPTNRHQRLVWRLCAALDATAPSELVVTQAVEVKITERVRYIPDLLVVTAEAAADHRRAQFLPHEVVLAVEIVSDSSRALDRILKPHQYASVGIPYYWRIEFEPEVAVYAYAIDLEGVYAPVGEFRDTLRLDAPWSISVDLKPLAG